MKIKIHKAYRIVIGLVDSDLIGKTFEEGNRQININTKFFDGEEKSKEEIIEILKDLVKEDATFNIVGKESIQTAIDAGIINEESIIKIDNIPIALRLL
jgi:hypothetical protein